MTGLDMHGRVTYSMRLTFSIFHAGCVHRPCVFDSLHSNVCDLPPLTHLQLCQRAQPARIFQQVWPSAP